MTRHSLETGSRMEARWGFQSCLSHPQEQRRHISPAGFLTQSALGSQTVAHGQPVSIASSCTQLVTQLSKLPKQAKAVKLMKGTEVKEE